MKINTLTAVVVAASVALPVAGFSAEQTQVQKLRELKCRALSFDGRNMAEVRIVDFKFVTDGQEKYSSKISVLGSFDDTTGNETKAFRFSGVAETDKDPAEERDSHTGWGGFLGYVQDAACFGCDRGDEALLLKPKNIGSDEEESNRSSYILAVGQTAEGAVKFHGFLGCTVK